MRKKFIISVGVLFFLVSITNAPAQEPIYWDVVQKIMDEAFDSSQVMENASWLCDVFGPRNTKTSTYIESAKWAKKRLEEYGLSNTRLEPYEFGVGWSNEYTSVHMISPQYLRIIAYPAAWSAGTDGKIRNKVTYINFSGIAKESDLDQFRENYGMTHLFTTGMAHEAYTEVGLPGFYFVQDRMDSRTYHSNMDVYDHLVPENLMTNSVILATLVYHAAMRDEILPRVKHQEW
jgi:hypothetical protein